VARVGSSKLSGIAARAALLNLGAAVRRGGAPQFHRRVQLLSFSAVSFPLFVRASESMPRTTQALLSAVGHISPARRSTARALRVAIVFPFSRFITYLLSASARSALWIAERREHRRLTR
jgi:hypothetical protein